MPIQTALVVDDSRLARLALTKLLKQRQITVDAVGSGGEALDFLKTNEPDIVFMDFMMPDMDGYEVTKQISEEPLTGHIPVVMCTSQDTAEDRARAESHGARGFLTKPTSPESLDEVLESVQSMDLKKTSTAEPEMSEPEPMVIDIEDDVVDEVEVVNAGSSEVALEPDVELVAETVEAQPVSEAPVSTPVAAGGGSSQVEAAVKEAAERMMARSVKTAVQQAVNESSERLKASILKEVDAVAKAAAEKAIQESAETIGKKMAAEVASEMSDASADRAVSNAERKAKEAIEDTATELREEFDRKLVAVSNVGELREKIVQAAVAEANKVVTKTSEGLKEQVVNMALDRAAESAQYAAKNVSETTAHATAVSVATKLINEAMKSEDREVKTSGMSGTIVVMLAAVVAAATSVGLSFVL